MGGGERWMIRAARGLAGRGHNVILASKCESEIIGAAARSGLRTAVMNIHRDVSPLETMRIARFLIKERIDILVCNLNKDVRVAGLAARLAGRPVVIARHGTLLCRRTWRHRMTLVNLTDGILTNAKSIKAIYDSYGWFGPDHVRVIYNGIENVPPGNAYDFSNELPGKKVIFSAGRLTELKGFIHLVRAASFIARERQDVVFVVAGRGDQEKSLAHNIELLGLSEHFRLIGYKEDVLPYVKGCDLFVLPSLSEGMPNAVMEAMAVGKPVVATAVSGVPELVEDRISGILVPPADPEALAREILGLLDDPGMARTMAQKARERVEENFTYTGMIEALESYFNEKIGARV